MGGGVVGWGMSAWWCEWGGVGWGGVGWGGVGCVNMYAGGAEAVQSRSPALRNYGWSRKNVIDVEGMSQNTLKSVQQDFPCNSSLEIQVSKDNVRLKMQVRCAASAGGGKGRGGWRGGGGAGRDLVVISVNSSISSLA